MDYFGKRNKFFNKAVANRESVSTNTSLYVNKIKIAKKVDHNLRRNTIAEFKDINSTRELKEHEEINISEDIKNTKTTFSLNMFECPPTPKENVIKYNNYTSEGETNRIDGGEAQQNKLNYITLQDYASLPLKEIPVFDLRSLNTYLKDEIYNNHRLLSLFLKHSKLDPIHIRSIKFIYHLSSSFAFSALCFTDTLIEKRSESEFKVKYAKLLSSISAIYLRMNYQK
jgi:hypothetical protein